MLLKHVFIYLGTKSWCFRDIHNMYR